MSSTEQLVSEDAVKPASRVMRQHRTILGGRSGKTAIAGYRLVGILAFLGLWEFLARSGMINQQFLTPPTGVAATLKEMISTGLLWTNVLATLKATFAGFVAGVLVGAAFGFVIGLSPSLSAFASPFITMMNSLPRIALAPLFVLWFGIGIESRIILVFSLVVFIVLTNTIAGAQSVERDHLVLAKLFRATRRDIVFKIALPSVLPWIMAAMRVSLAYAISGAVVGEMFLGQEGLGYLIVAGSGVFNISQVFAALVVVVIIAYMLDSLFRLVERRLFRWRLTS